MGLGPVDPKASLGAGETLEPRAARAATASRERRGTLALKDPAAWLERSAAKEPREIGVCLDQEAPREPLGSPGSRDLEETLVMLGPAETQDSQVPRETPAGLDSATQDPEGHPERKANLACLAQREAEETLA